MNNRTLSLKQISLHFCNRVKWLLSNIDRWLFIERLFLLLTCIVVGYVILYFILLSPLHNTKNRLTTKIQSSNRQLEMLKKQEANVVAQAAKKKKADKEQYDQLLNQLHELDENIKSFNKGFFSASQAAAKLRTTFDQYDSLRWRSLVSLPVKVLVRPTEGEQELSTEGVILTFQGEYFDVLSYLRQVEQLDMHVFWNELKYNVTDYPVADVTINIDVLSPLKKNGRQKNV